jgi:hypothetical protein
VFPKRHGADPKRTFSVIYFYLRLLFLVYGQARLICLD